MQALGLRDLHAAELGPPLVEGGVAETPIAATFPDSHARLRLPQGPNDLSLAALILLPLHHSSDNGLN